MEPFYFFSDPVLGVNNYFWIYGTFIINFDLGDYFDPLTLFLNLKPPIDVTLLF